jgi:hypothetical protein
MKTDKNGVSQCPKGQEQYEHYFSAIAQKELVQYDYRTPNGKLFSCVKPTLELCRQARDKWLLPESEVSNDD